MKRILKAMVISFLMHTSCMAMEGVALLSFDLHTTYAQGVTYRKAGQFSEARKSFERVLTYSKDHVQSLHNLGSIAYSEKQYDQAVAFFDRAARLNFPPSQRNLLVMTAKGERNSTEKERFLAI